jgi:hypothetical protein
MDCSNLIPRNDSMSPFYLNKLSVSLDNTFGSGSPYHDDDLSASLANTSIANAGKMKAEDTQVSVEQSWYLPSPSETSPVSSNMEKYSSSVSYHAVESEISIAVQNESSTATFKLATSSPADILSESAFSMYERKNLRLQDNRPTEPTEICLSLHGAQATDSTIDSGYALSQRNPLSDLKTAQLEVLTDQGDSNISRLLKRGRFLLSRIEESTATSLISALLEPSSPVSEAILNRLERTGIENDEVSWDDIVQLVKGGRTLFALLPKETVSDVAQALRRRDSPLSDSIVKRWPDLEDKNEYAQSDSLICTSSTIQASSGISSTNAAFQRTSHPLLPEDLDGTGEDQEVAALIGRGTRSQQQSQILTDHETVSQMNPVAATEKSASGGMEGMNTTIFAKVQDVITRLPLKIGTRVVDALSASSTVVADSILAGLRPAMEELDTLAWDDLVQIVKNVRQQLPEGTVTEIVEALKFVNVPTVDANHLKMESLNVEQVHSVNPIVDPSASDSSSDKHVNDQPQVEIRMAHEKDLLTMMPDYADCSQVSLVVNRGRSLLNRLPKEEATGVLSALLVRNTHASSHILRHLHHAISSSDSVWDEISDVVVTGRRVLANLPELSLIQVLYALGAQANAISIAIVQMICAASEYAQIQLAGSSESTAKGRKGALDYNSLASEPHSSDSPDEISALLSKGRKLLSQLTVGAAARVLSALAERSARISAIILDNFFAEVSLEESDLPRVNHDEIAQLVREGRDLLARLPELTAMEVVCALENRLSVVAEVIVRRSDLHQFAREGLVDTILPANQSCAMNESSLSLEIHKSNCANTNGEASSIAHGKEYENLVQESPGSGKFERTTTNEGHQIRSKVLPPSCSSARNGPNSECEDISALVARGRGLLSSLSHGAASAVLTALTQPSIDISDDIIAQLHTVAKDSEVAVLNDISAVVWEGRALLKQLPEYDAEELICALECRNSLISEAISRKLEYDYLNQRQLLLNDFSKLNSSTTHLYQTSDTKVSPEIYSLIPDTRISGRSDSYNAPENLQKSVLFHDSVSPQRQESKRERIVPPNGPELDNFLANIKLQLSRLSPRAASVMLCAIQDASEAAAAKGALRRFHEESQEFSVSALDEVLTLIDEGHRLMQLLPETFAFQLAVSLNVRESKLSEVIIRRINSANSVRQPELMMEVQTELAKAVPYSTEMIDSATTSKEPYDTLLKSLPSGQNESNSKEGHVFQDHNSGNSAVVDAQDVSGSNVEISHTAENVVTKVSAVRDSEISTGQRPGQVLGSGYDTSIIGSGNAAEVSMPSDEAAIAIGIIEPIGGSEKSDNTVGREAMGMRIDWEAMADVGARTATVGVRAAKARSAGAVKWEDEEVQALITEGQQLLRGLAADVAADVLGALANPSSVVAEALLRRLRGGLEGYEVWEGVKALVDEGRELLARLPAGSAEGLVRALEERESVVAEGIARGLQGLGVEWGGAEMSGGYVYEDGGGSRADAISGGCETATGDWPVKYHTAVMLGGNLSEDGGGLRAGAISGGNETVTRDLKEERLTEEMTLSYVQAAGVVTGETSDEAGGGVARPGVENEPEMSTGQGSGDFGPMHVSLSYVASAAGPEVAADERMGSDEAETARGIIKPIGGNEESVSSAECETMGTAAIAGGYVYENGGGSRAISDGCETVTGDGVVECQTAVMPGGNAYEDGDDLNANVSWGGNETATRDGLEEHQTEDCQAEEMVSSNGQAAGAVTVESSDGADGGVARPGEENEPEISTGQGSGDSGPLHMSSSVVASAAGAKEALYQRMGSDEAETARGMKEPIGCREKSDSSKGREAMGMMGNAKAMAAVNAGPATDAGAGTVKWEDEDVLALIAEGQQLLRGLAADVAADVLGALANPSSLVAEALLRRLRGRLEGSGSDSGVWEGVKALVDEGRELLARLPAGSAEGLVRALEERESVITMFFHRILHFSGRSCFPSR